MQNNETNRFTFNKEGTTITVGDITMTAKKVDDNIETIKKMMTTIEEPLKVGDLVALKNTNQLVEVKFLKNMVKNNIGVDYVGKLYGTEEDSNYVLFNQEDVSEKLQNPKMIAK